MAYGECSMTIRGNRSEMSIHLCEMIGRTCINQRQTGNENMVHGGDIYEQ